MIKIPYFERAVPMNITNGKKEESWWDKRQKRMKKFAKEVEEKAAKEAAVRTRMQQEIGQLEGMKQNLRLKEFLNPQEYGNQNWEEYGFCAAHAKLMYESLISSFGILHHGARGGN